MTVLYDGADGVASRDRIEAALAQYPHLDQERLTELIAWFRDEATALDVGMVASNPDIAAPYRQFRRDHIDQITGVDLMRAAMFLAVVVAIAVAIVWRAL